MGMHQQFLNKIQLKSVSKQKIKTFIILYFIMINESVSA